MSDSESNSSSTTSLDGRGPASRRPPPPPPLPHRHESRSQDQPLSTRHSEAYTSRASALDTDSYIHHPRPSSYRPRPNSRHDSNPEVDQALVRNSIIALDRKKRRLTGSAYEHDRRRTPGDFYGRSSQPGEQNPSADAMSLQPTVSHETPSRNEVIDLTASSPPLPASTPHHPRASRTSSSSSRRYVVPRWQPDSEVGECPICKRPFTFIFRRHHCRKCGRVVCNDCSPHRITIPRQFIVNSPGSDITSSPTYTTSQSETIYLTGADDDDDAAATAVSTPRFSRNSMHPLFDSGEKVRLCNPCVPDPQPEPLPNFPPLQHMNTPPTTFDPRLAPVRFPGAPAGLSPFGQLGQRTRFGSSGFGQGRADFPPSPTVPGTIFTSRPRPSSMANPYPNRFPFSTSPGVDVTRPYNNPLPPLPRNPQMPSGYGHSRFSSMDTDSRAHQPDFFPRPRIGSLMESSNRPSMPSHLSPRPNPEPRPRTRINEADMCPVCRRALPEQGPNGDETAREAHIMACISARDPNSTGDAGSSSRGLLHMIAFAASEKDCVGEDGNVQECSICMEEYDVGAELARLECWCKFHKRCIVSWLNKKPECPVHKASAMHYT